jgi:hypothetical protein
MKKFEVAPEIEIFRPVTHPRRQAVDRRRPDFTEAARAIRERAVGLIEK